MVWIKSKGGTSFITFSLAIFLICQISEFKCDSLAGNDNDIENGVLDQEDDRNQEIEAHGEGEEEEEESDITDEERTEEEETENGNKKSQTKELAEKNVNSQRDSPKNNPSIENSQTKITSHKTQPIHKDKKSKTSHTSTQVENKMHKYHEEHPVLKHKNMTKSHNTLFHKKPRFTKTSTLTVVDAECPKKNVIENELTNEFKNAKIHCVNKSSKEGLLMREMVVKNDENEELGRILICNAKKYQISKEHASKLKLESNKKHIFIYNPNGEYINLHGLDKSEYNHFDGVYHCPNSSSLVSTDGVVNELLDPMDMMKLLKNQMDEKDEIKRRLMTNAATIVEPVIICALFAICIILGLVIAYMPKSDKSNEKGHENTNGNLAIAANENSRRSRKNSVDGSRVGEKFTI